MSILVTGAAGQLGAELCRQLGAEATGVDIDTLDLTDRAAVLETLRRLAPRAVIHCAAYTQVDPAETDAARCRAVNVTAVESLAAACRELDSPLVQLSTDYVFAGRPGIGRPWREDDLPVPKGVYAVTKFEGEQAAAAWPKHLIVRTCGLYARPSQARGPQLREDDPAAGANAAEVAGGGRSALHADLRAARGAGDLVFAGDRRRRAGAVGYL